eukprot:4338897-Pyramimonas_sp.AAC.1
MARPAGGPCRSWEDASGVGPEFSMGQGRCSLDTVWRQAVRSELATGTNLSHATPLWDLLQFYERIGHQELVQQGLLCDFPLHVLIYTVSTYRWQRLLLLDGAYSQGLTPTSGIVAGSTSATYEAKAFMRALHAKAVMRLSQGKDYMLTIFLFTRGMNVQLHTLRTSELLRRPWHIISLRI